MRTPKGLCAIVTTEEIKIIPKTEDEPDMYLKRLIYLEYLATPGADTSTKAIEELSSNLNVTRNTLKRWRRNTSFQAMLAKRLRDQMTGGLGLAIAYQEMINLISSPSTPAHIKARVCSDLTKLDLKREAMYLKFKATKEKSGRNTTRKTFEQEVEDAKFKVIE